MGSEEQSTDFPAVNLETSTPSSAATPPAASLDTPTPTSEEGFGFQALAGSLDQAGSVPVHSPYWVALISDSGSPLTQALVGEPSEHEDRFNQLGAAVHVMCGTDIGTYDDIYDPARYSSVRLGSGDAGVPSRAWREHFGFQPATGEDGYGVVVLEDLMVSRPTLDCVSQARRDVFGDLLSFAGLAESSMRFPSLLVHPFTLMGHDDEWIVCMAALASVDPDTTTVEAVADTFQSEPEFALADHSCLLDKRFKNDEYHLRELAADFVTNYGTVLES